jgi:dipeptidyl aminopeptidase/acylaminoacyl peptidase/predicted dienelactone hydrolase
MIRLLQRRALLLTLPACFITAIASAAEPARRVPTVEDLLLLKSVGGVSISPEGKWVAYIVNETDFKNDAFLSHIWLADTVSGRRFQLTRGDKSAGSMHWSPDGQWLAFTSGRGGDKNQLFAIAPDGGEAVQLTKFETGVSDFAWSPDGKSIAIAATHSNKEGMKNRKEHLGDFEVVRREYNHNHLWTIAVAEAFKSPQSGQQRTKGKDFSVGSFSWSPDSSKIAFGATVNPDLIQVATSDIYVLDLGDNAVKKIVSQPGPDTGPRWSPDGKQIVFRSAMGKKLFFHANARLAVVDAAGGTPRSITDGFDETPFRYDWKPGGVYFAGLQKTASHLFRVDPVTAAITRITGPDNLMMDSFSISDDGRKLAFSAASPTSMSEVFISDVHNFKPRKLTDLTEQTKPFVMGRSEVISWKSPDGTTIEGVLTKPADFDPAKKHPLLCILHGGPTGVDSPRLHEVRHYYPLHVWAGRGALILRVNYRGSAGYGEKFRQLNVRNLGVGDAWDVLSGVDHLIAKGWVDPAKVGCMGWSQGGYISAFLTASSQRFAAISVGAGISNWATYYYNTDITPFTIQYLGTSPIDDPEIYQKTSPMSYLKKAKTPTLIQHGENDRRVPIANAYELRQGLEDRRINVEMIVYKGFGHGISKPRSMRAVMQHNLAWFNHYIWGDPLPDFANPEVPNPEVPKKEKNAAAEDPSAGRTPTELGGTWRGKIVADRFLYALQLKIEDDGSGWKGQVILSAEGVQSTHPLRELRLSDNEVSFVTKIQAWEVRMKGKLAKDRMSGTAEGRQDSGKGPGPIEWGVVRASGRQESSRPAAAKKVVNEKIVLELPRPTGPAGVGRASLYWKDTSRQEVLSDDPRAKRELVVDFWYPAQPQAGSPLAPYMANAKAIVEAKADSSLPSVQSVRTNAVTDAPFAAAPRRAPILIFSHGLGVQSAYYSSLLEELASHGYVVAAIQHTYTMSAVVFPDGRLVPFGGKKWQAGDQDPLEKRMRFYREITDVWASDAVFVLNQLAKLDEGTPGSALKGRLDLKHVGIFGHSFGGIAAPRACQLDDRFRACINLDGMRTGLVYLPNEAGQGPRQPFLYMGTRRMMTDGELAIMGLTRDQYGELERKHLRRTFAALEKLQSKASLALLENTKHMSFSDTPLFSPTAVPQPLDVRLRTLQIIRDLTRRYFDRHVRGNASARWPMEQPGVLIESFGP